MFGYGKFYIVPEMQTFLSVRHVGRQAQLRHLLGIVAAATNEFLLFLLNYVYNSFSIIIRY